MITGRKAQRFKKRYQVTDKKDSNKILDNIKPTEEMIIKRGAYVPFKNIMHPKAGFTFGIMELRELITPEQFQAGSLAVGVMIQRLRVLGVPKPAPRVMRYDDISGVLRAEDLTDEQVQRNKRHYENLMSLVKSNQDWQLGMSLFEMAVMRETPINEIYWLPELTNRHKIALYAREWNAFKALLDDWVKYFRLD